MVLVTVAASQVALCVFTLCALFGMTAWESYLSGLIVFALQLLLLFRFDTRESARYDDE